MKRKLGFVAVVLVGAFVGATLPSCAFWKAAEPVIVPSLVQLCQRECVESGHADWAPGCAIAGQIADIMTKISAERSAKIAACKCSVGARDAGVD